MAIEMYLRYLGVKCSLQRLQWIKEDVARKVFGEAFATHLEPFALIVPSPIARESVRAR